jgi:hypothetical protein
MERPKYCCQKCGECIGYLGIFLNLITFNRWHKCIKKHGSVAKKRTQEELERTIVHHNEKPTTERPNHFGIKKKDNIGYNIHKEYKTPRHIQDIKNFLDKCERLLR